MTTYQRRFAALGALIVLCSTAKDCWSDEKAVPYNERVWSYTAEEMYDRAEALVRLGLMFRDGNPPEHGKDLIDLGVKAAEFIGYVAATLDEQTENKAINDCAKRLPMRTIAARTASLYTSVPLDRSKKVNHYVIALTIAFACDDGNVQKKPN